MRPPTADEAANWCYGQVVDGHFAIVDGELLVEDDQDLQRWEDNGGR